ncbi:acetoacetate decarboxylase family protein [Nocardia terpenica]|nr:acetoacetate decarboxylase family protein [Nocardia terpenica]MBF6062540.1 acetoacetate decarboxylase family protein [Nocardia terpenica]MBF6104628.1 acetoacetate decarboxylase family protein [Nocardia terpenica]MBF6109517.1 acetoacetate decarboxylase family protein [Nocardia terpenica]MBF6123705.1 acetoacetate decarboxylase family protein [Nocardia terpenica]MBF6157037.1 acetoacetate decarboxylase family protein [Nocardia terpenica]
MAVHTVLGEQVRMPVEIRVAEALSALYLVDEAAARTLLAGTGLEPVRCAGRALCALAFVRYVDGDLGPYHEFAVALIARVPGRRRSTGAYIHWLPVNQEFTCAAGRQIWGFPKEVADIRLARRWRGKRCEVWLDGRMAVALEIRGGLPVPAVLGGASIAAYTQPDGVLRRTPWGMRPSRVRLRLGGGARLELGDHPVADELRALGLPGRAISTTRIGVLRMTFEDAMEVR